MKLSIWIFRIHTERITACCMYQVPYSCFRVVEGLFLGDLASPRKDSSLSAPAFFSFPLFAPALFSLSIFHQYLPSPSHIDTSSLRYRSLSFSKQKLHNRHEQPKSTVYTGACVGNDDILGNCSGPPPTRNQRRSEVNKARQ